MGWLADWFARVEGPVNSAAWRKAHPEYKGPHRKKGTKLDLCHTLNMDTEQVQAMIDAVTVYPK